MIINFNHPVVMGIINVTPDSFYSQSRVVLKDEILTLAQKHLNNGAKILDIGGYSTRPGAVEISVTEEINRIREAVIAIKKKYPGSILSIDTFRAQVADVALSLGCQMVNDVSGLQFDKEMINVIKKHNASVVLMHSNGNPKNFHATNSTDNILEKMMVFFYEKINSLQQAGVQSILVDPGFGFSKTIGQNFTILNNLDCFQKLKLPVLVGISRKSFIYKSLNISTEDTLLPTTAIHLMCLTKNAAVLRVHDVKEAVEICNLYRNITDYQ